MGWSGRHILSALLLTFIGITLFSGCKSKGSSSPPPTASPGGPDANEEGQPTVSEPVNPDGPLPTVAEYEAQNNPALLGAQSTYQRIRRDEIYGELTPEDAARQRICAYCGSDCLLEEYRDPDPEDNGKECGNHASQLIEYDISRFPDLIDFFEQACADTSGTTQQLMKPQGGGTLKTAVINPRPPAQLFERFFGYTEITAKNGITFTVRADDKVANECEYKQIDSKTRVFTPGGPFDVYYRSQDASAFNDVSAAISNQQFWTYCNEVFGQCETNAYYNHENPSVFLIGKIKGEWGGLMVSKTDKGKGYIIVDSGSPSSACQQQPRRPGGGEGGGGSGGGIPGVDEEIHWFLRADYPSYSNTEWLQSATIHELFHFAEMSHFSSYSKFSHPFIESFADWMTKLVYPQSSKVHQNYHNFIYYPHFPFDNHSVSEDKNYGASIFWSFVSCHAGRSGQSKTAPIRKHEACIDGLPNFSKADYRKCAREGMEYGSKKVSEVLLNFGESILMSTGGDGFIGMDQCDPVWQLTYLPGSIQATPHFLVDSDHGGSNLTAGETASPALEFDLNTFDFSVSYYVWLSNVGDTYNNFYEFNLERCADPLVKCSLFGYLIKDDRVNFDVERYKVPSDGKRTIKFKGLDSEPDIWVLVAADGRTVENMNVGLGDPAFIETKPLSGPVEFSAAMTDNSGDSNNYTHFSLSFDGTLDYPGDDFPTQRVPPDMPVVGPDLIAAFNLAPESHNPPIDDFHLNSIVPLKSGQIQWNMEYKRTLGFMTLNRSCPATFNYSVTYSSQGTRSISLETGDGVHWGIRGRDSEGNNAEIMDFEVAYGQDSLDVDFQKTAETCSASATCCQRGLENENLEPTSIPTTRVSVEGTFYEGELSQTLNETTTRSGGVSYQTMATLTYPERLEVPEYWDNGNDYSSGQLYYEDRDDDLMWQLAPEIIDFPRTVVPSRVVRQSMQTQNPPDI